MASTNANVTVWFILINANHRPIYDCSFSVDLPEDATISRLESKIREDLLQNKSHICRDLDIHEVWRCTDRATRFTEGDKQVLEKEVKKCFTDNEVRKLVRRLKIQDLQLLDTESLLVQVTVARPVWYLTVDHAMRPIRKGVSEVTARFIADLAESAREGSPRLIGHLKPSELTVWKSTASKLWSNARLTDLTNIIDEINFHDESEAVELVHGALVTDFDLSDGEVLLVQMPGSHEDEEGGDRRFPLPSDENLNLDYEITYSRIRSVRAPSTNSRSTEYSKNQRIDRNIIYDGIYAPGEHAPSTNAPPVHMYHPIFWQFTRDANDPSIVSDSDFLTSVRRFMAKSCRVSGDELVSNKKLRSRLQKLLEWHMPVESNDDDTRSDGVIMFNHSKARTPMVIMEFQRSLGEGGCDPSIQAGNSMRRKLGEDQSKLIVDKCCSPVFMLAGGGPWLCILGGVFINRFVVQRLTDMMWIGFATTHEDHRVYQVAKVLLALRNSLRDLNRFYEFVVTTKKIPEFNTKKKPHPRHFPYPHSFIDVDGSLVVFEYLGRLERGMTCVTFLAKVKDTDEKIVVKFVDRYGAEVHQFLAEQGHAPRLRYYGPLPEKTIYDSSEAAPAAQKPMNAGYQRLSRAVAPEMRMVVMEYISPSKPRLDDLELSRDQVSTVLEKLRTNGYVFGDLRAPNVLFDANDEVKLIDFDWAGRYDIKDLSPEQQENVKKTWARFNQGMDDSGALGRYTVEPTMEERAEAEDVLRTLAPRPNEASDFFSRYAQLTVDERIKVKKAWSKLDDLADTPFASYPIGLSLTLPWPAGAASRSPILPAHDTEMLAKLYKQWLTTV